MEGQKMKSKMFLKGARQVFAVTAATLLSWLIATTGVAHAVSYTVGDVFASVGGGLVREFTPTGTLVQTLNNGIGSTFTTGSTFDAAGNFYVTTFSSGVVSKFDNNGVLVSSTFATCAVSDCESIVRDLSGNFYVGHADGTQDITKYNSAGALIATFNPTTGPRGTDWIDLAADQRTIFYTSEGGTIRRFDTLTNTQLTDFASPGGTMFALRLLSDGGLLVAHTNNILRLNSAGAVTQTCTNFGGTPSELFALNLDPDGTSFWTGDLGTNLISHINLADCGLINSFSAGSGTLAGLSIFGERTEGGGGGGTGKIPEPSSFLLLGAGLVSVARFIRKSQR